MKVTRKMIDPQLRFTAMLARLLTRNSAFTEANLRKQAANPSWLRKMQIRMLQSLEGVQIEEKWIPRDDGTQLRILIKRSSNPKENVPGILHLHGGGYYGGTPELDWLSRRYIEASNCVIVSPDYRLSLEAPYPAALEDCYTALLWLKENAAELGVRDDQLIVTGESAGGGLTAATTLYARDKGEVNIAFQMPLYPMIDDRNNSESAQDNDAPGWNQHTNEVGWKLYLGDLWGTEDVPYYAAPARATDYTGLPPTYTYVGSIDPFCSETVEYIENLKQAGVAAEIDIYEGAFHGYEAVKPSSDVAIKTFERLEQWFIKALREYTAPQA